MGDITLARLRHQRQRDPVFANRIVAFGRAEEDAAQALACLARACPKRAADGMDDVATRKERLRRGVGVNDPPARVDEDHCCPETIEETWADSWLRRA